MEHLINYFLNGLLLIILIKQVFIKTNECFMKDFLKLEHHFEGKKI